MRRCGCTAPRLGLMAPVTRCWVDIQETLMQSISAWLLCSECQARATDPTEAGMKPESTIALPSPVHRARTPLRLVVQDQLVPTIDGRLRASINLDHAASTPALVPVHEAVERFVPVVLEHPSRRRLPVAGCEPRLRGRARRGRGLRRRGRRPGRRAGAQHDRSAERAVVGDRTAQPCALLVDGAPREPAAVAGSRARDDALRREPGRAARDLRGDARPRARSGRSSCSSSPPHPT